MCYTWIIPEPSLLSAAHEKIVFHEAGLWCQKRLGTTALGDCKKSAQIYAEVGTHDMLGGRGVSVLEGSLFSFLFLILKVVSFQIYFL